MTGLPVPSNATVHLNTEEGLWSMILSDRILVFDLHALDYRYSVLIPYSLVQCREVHIDRRRAVCSASTVHVYSSVTPRNLLHRFYEVSKYGDVSFMAAHRRMVLML